MIQIITTKPRPMFISDHHCTHVSIRITSNGQETDIHRKNEWIANVSDHTPIESQNAHAQTSVGSEQGVDDNFVRSNPTYPIKNAQGSEEISGDEVP